MPRKCNGKPCVDIVFTISNVSAPTVTFFPKGCKGAEPPTGDQVKVEVEKWVKANAADSGCGGEESSAIIKCHCVRTGAPPAKTVEQGILYEIVDPNEDHKCRWRITGTYDKTTEAFPGLCSFS
jgi:hypothetical protein